MESKDSNWSKRKRIYKEKNRKKRARIIIRNLPFKITEDTLKEYFDKYGKIEEIKILKKEDGRSIGCGFIQFDHVQSAAKAIHHANMKPLQGRSMVVDWAIPKNRYKQDKNTTEDSKDNGNVEIKEEPEECDDDDDKSVIGITDETNLSNNKTNYMDVSTEEIKEDEEDSSEEEIQEIKDEEVIEESPEEEEEEEEDKELIKRKKIKLESNDVEEGKTIFLKNVPFSTTNDELKKFMENFGPVHYALICIDPLTEHSRGTAFVKFKNIEDSEKCLLAGTELRLRDAILEPHKALSRKNIMDKNNLKKQKEKDSRNLYLVKEGVITAGSQAAIGVSATDMAKRLQLERWKSQILRNLNMFVSRVRLVVQNLPPSCDDTKLRLIFKKYSGTDVIREARVMRDLKNIDANGLGKSKEFGFVSFTKHEDALRALRAINNNPNIFTPYKRPIVAFSIENRIMVNAKQRRMEKSLARNPLYSGNKNTIDKESMIKKPIKDNNESMENDEKIFSGVKSKPGQTKIRSRFNIKNQAILHSKVTKQEKKVAKREQRSRKMKIEKTKKVIKFKKSAKKGDAESANFNKLVESYKNKLMSIGPTRSKWYDTSST